MRRIANQRRSWVAACAALLSTCVVVSHASAQEQASTDAAVHWQALTRIDSDAAMTLLTSSHPGAAPELHDTAFQARLDTARRHLAERLPNVRNIAGYTAVMAGLATDMKDGHIWSRPVVQPVLTQWTGIVLGRQDHQWIVAYQLPIPGQPDLGNARLVSCDGVDAETWATQRIDLFHGNAQIEAEKVDAASWLLFDQGNPFLKRPEACVFQRPNEAPVQLTLHWGGGSRDFIDDALAKAAPDISIGLGMQPHDGGYWINLGNLHQEAAKLVSDVKQKQAQLREAPFVVVDLRGNGGGNSLYAEQLAETLVGKPRVDALDVPQPCSGSYWRISEGNIKARAAQRAFVDDTQRAAYDASTETMRKALAAGDVFSPKLPPCASRPASRALAQTDKLPPSQMKGRLIIVTDHACFSSCLLTVDLFRQIGAMQVGEATDMSTRYMEVRQIMLPSGLSTFSTLQKVALEATDFGPYEPVHSFPGKMSDTPALQAWVATLVR